MNTRQRSAAALLVIGLLPLPSAADPATLTLRPGGAGLWLWSSDDQPMIDLRPTVEIVPADGKLARVVMPPFRRATDDAAILESRAEDGVGGDWTVRLEPAGVGLRLVSTVQFQRPLRTRSITLRLQVADLDRAAVLGRDYRVRGLGPTGAIVDALTPRVAFFGRDTRAFAVHGQAGVEALGVQPDGPSAFQLAMELDHAGNHPFHRYTRCADRVADEVRRVDASHRQWVPGERHQAIVWLLPGDASPPRVARLPYGYAAALSFTDHADQSNLAKLEAFAFGRTGAVAAGEIGAGHPGFVNRDLQYTKTVFVEPVQRYDPQFDQPGYAALLKRLDERSVEIGLHSVTGWKDDRRTVQTLLKRFADRFTPYTWIDHQPHTNCEALSNEGGTAGSPWYIADLLAERGVRTVWSVNDVALPGGSINLLEPSDPLARRPVFFPHPTHAHAFTLFNTTWMFFKNRRRFLALFDDARLDALEASWGISIGHVYLDTHRRSGRMKGRSLLDEVGHDRYRLAPEADALFQRLAERQRGRGLWVTGVDALAQHAVRAMALPIHYAVDGTAEIGPPPGGALNGVTLLFPDADRVVQWRVDGSPAKDVGHRNGYSFVVLDLPAGATRTLAVDRAGRATPFVPPSRIVVSP